MILRSAADQPDGRILTHEELKHLFSNVELIVGINQEALRQLNTKINECGPSVRAPTRYSRRLRSKDDPHVGVVFLGLAPYFKCDAPHAFSVISLLTSA